MEAAAQQEQGIDSLAHLEERITKAVQAITTLRSENQQLQQRLKTALDELKAASGARDTGEARATAMQRERDELNLRVKRLSDELDDLRGERKQVRTRIEKLLSQLDLLSAS
jgi:chromosome segregation ATPase